VCKRVHEALPNSTESGGHLNFSFDFLFCVKLVDPRATTAAALEAIELVVDVDG
jgi:RNase H-fold protein (predicted Holliday junction resolvase)